MSFLEDRSQIIVRKVPFYGHVSIRIYPKTNLGKNVKKTGKTDFLSDLQSKGPLIFQISHVERI